ncbi:misacylated tRNA(Ala) deacylase [Faunimonas pinastri]|uniref:Alanine--tRNA ligase n=1 Tax=Faunimonas pinastri TaxID=1855383 RepID=A0A1H9CIK9_9HYPH|nr:alanyl-tRNA editing protein [Faunimonas pinastri]SEQ01009.1 misacylated tRNA(Ala) deacylase [Faunimonas pinastri]
MTTELLFRDDAYAEDCEAVVVSAEGNRVVLDRTVFYANAGGQAGDSGRLIVLGKGILPVENAVYSEDKSDVVHLLPVGAELPEVGSVVRAEVDWDRRHRHMRMHTALHLLCSLIPFPVTGGSIGSEESRLDFDISDADAVEREALTVALNRLVSEDHPVTTRWISDEELEANPSLVRTMSVKPPMGSGRIRLVAIGADEGVDLQPCGGTHVRSTGEIGPVVISKIDKKGRQNRRIRVRFAEEGAPEGTTA